MSRSRVVGYDLVTITLAQVAPIRVITTHRPQVNARIPSNVASGDMPVAIKVGDSSSQPRLTVRVR